MTTLNDDELAQLAGFLSAQNWANASTRIDRLEFWMEKARRTARFLEELSANE